VFASLQPKAALPAKDVAVLAEDVRTAIDLGIQESLEAEAARRIRSVVLVF
jgi:hypothetical protein